MSQIENFESQLQQQLQPKIQDNLTQSDLESVIRNLEAQAITTFENTPDLIVESFHSVFQTLSSLDTASQVEKTLLQNSLSYVRCIELHCILKKLMGRSFDNERYSITNINRSKPLGLNVNDFMPILNLDERGVFTKLELLREIDECRQLNFVSLTASADNPTNYARALMFKSYFQNINIQSPASVSSVPEQNDFAEQVIMLAPLIVTFGRKVEVPENLPNSCKNLLGFINSGVKFSFKNNKFRLSVPKDCLHIIREKRDINIAPYDSLRNEANVILSPSIQDLLSAKVIEILNLPATHRIDSQFLFANLHNFTLNNLDNLDVTKEQFKTFLQNRLPILKFRLRNLRFVQNIQTLISHLNIQDRAVLNSFNRMLYSVNSLFLKRFYSSQGFNVSFDDNTSKLKLTPIENYYLGIDTTNANLELDLNSAFSLATQPISQLTQTLRVTISPNTVVVSRSVSPSEPSTQADSSARDSSTQHDTSTPSRDRSPSASDPSLDGGSRGSTPEQVRVRGGSGPIQSAETPKSEDAAPAQTDQVESEEQVTAGEQRSQAADVSGDQAEASTDAQNDAETGEQADAQTAAETEREQADQTNPRTGQTRSLSPQDSQTEVGTASAQSAAQAQVPDSSQPQAETTRGATPTLPTAPSAQATPTQTPAPTMPQETPTPPPSAQDTPTQPTQPSASMQPSDQAPAPTAPRVESKPPSRETPEPAPNPEVTQPIESQVENGGQITPTELPQAASQSISEDLPVTPIEISRFRRRLKLQSDGREYTDRLSLNSLNHQQATEINSGETSSNTPNQYDLQRVRYFHPRTIALTAETFKQTMRHRNLKDRFYGLHNGQMLIRDNSGAFSLRTLDSNGPMTVNSEHITAVTTQTEGLPSNWQAFSNFLEKGYSLKSRGSGSSLQFQLSSPDSQVKSNWFRCASQSEIPFRSIHHLNPGRDLVESTIIIPSTLDNPDLLVFENLSSGVYLAGEARGNSLFAVVASDATDYLLTTARFNYANQFGAWFQTNRSALRSLYPAMQTDDPIEYLKVAYRDRDQVSSYLTTLDLAGEEYFKENENSAVSESPEVSDPSIVIEPFQMDSIRESSNIYSSVSVSTAEQFRALGLETSSNTGQLFGDKWRSRPDPVNIVGKLFQNPSRLSNGMRNLITKLILIDLFNADKYPESVRTQLIDIQQKYNVITRSISTVNPTEARLELFMQDPNVLFARFNRTQRLYYLEVMQFLLQNSDFYFQHGRSTRSFISVMPCFGMIQSEFRSIQLSDTINSEFRINPGQKIALVQSTLFTVNDSSITQFNGQDLASPIQIPDGAKIILEQPTSSSSHFILKLLRSDGSQIASHQLRYNPNSGTLKNQSYTREYHRVMRSVNSSFTQEPVDLFVIDGQAKVLNSRVISNLSILTTAYSSVESMPELSAQAQIYVESSTRSASVYINEAKIIDGDNTYVIRFETSQELSVSSSPEVNLPTFYAQTENTSLHSFGNLRPLPLQSFFRNLEGDVPDIQQKLRSGGLRANICITHELNQQLGLQKRRGVIDDQALSNFVVDNNLKFLFDTEFIQFKKVGDLVMFRYMPFGDFLEFTDETIRAVNRSISEQASQEFTRLSTILNTAREAHARSVQQSQEPVSILTENNDIDAKVSTLNNRLRGLGVNETVTYNRTTKFFEFKNKRYLNLFLFDSNNCINLNDQIISNSPPDQNFTSFQVNQLRYNPDNLVGLNPSELLPVSDDFANLDAFIQVIRRYKKETISWNGQSLICNPEGKDYLENIPGALRGLLNIEGPFVVRNNRRRIDDRIFVLPSITNENIFRIDGLEGIRILPSHAQSLKAARMLDDDSNLGLGMADFIALLGSEIGVVMYSYFTTDSIQVNQIPFEFFPFNFSTRLEGFRMKLPQAYLETLTRPFPVMIDSQESLDSQSTRVAVRDYFTVDGKRSQRLSGVSVHSSGAFSTTGFTNVRPLDEVSQTVMPDGFTFGLFRGYLHTKSTAETPSSLSSLATKLNPYGLVVGEYFFPRINQSTRNPSQPEYHTPPIKMSLSDAYSVDRDGKLKLNGRDVCTLHNKAELNIAATHALAESLRNRFTTNNQFTSLSDGSNTVFNGEFRLVLPANLQVRKYSAEAPDLDLRQSVTSFVKNSVVENDYLVTQNGTQYRIKFND